MTKIEDKYIVYKHTSPSGKVYIGITRQLPEKRWKYGSGYEGNIHFSNAIKKYGWNNFSHEILFDGLTESEAKQREIDLIAFYDSSNRSKGYNVSPGGCTVSKETVKKIQETRDANGVTERERERMLSVWADQEKRRKIVAAMQNKPRTEEQKKHYKEASAYRIGKPLPDKTKKKISSIMKTKTGEMSSRKRKVYKISPVDGSVVKEYVTARQAAIEIGAKPISSISAVCRGGNQYKRRFKKGYYWCYADDYNEVLKTIELNPQITPNGKLRKKPEENPMFGRSLSRDAIEKIRKAHIKPVMCLETGAIYESIAEAAKACSLKGGESISRQLSGKQKRAVGYTWEYINN